MENAHKLIEKKAGELTTEKAKEEQLDVVVGRMVGDLEVSKKTFLELEDKKRLIDA